MKAEHFWIHLTVHGWRYVREHTYDRTSGGFSNAERLVLQCSCTQTAGFYRNNSLFTESVEVVIRIGEPRVLRDPYELESLPGHYDLIETTLGAAAYIPSMRDEEIGLESEGCFSAELVVHSEMLRELLEYWNDLSEIRLDLVGKVRLIGPIGDVYWEDSNDYKAQRNWLNIIGFEFTASSSGHGSGNDEESS